MNINNLLTEIIKLMTDRNNLLTALEEVTTAGYEEAHNGKDEPLPWDKVLIYREDLKKYRELVKLCKET